MRLIEAGVNDCEIARRTRIPRTTIRDWRRPNYVPRRDFAIETCPRCWRAAKPMRFTPNDYAEILGLYLGDGCISRTRRAFRLRIALDLRYPVVISDARKLLARCFPANRVDIVTTGVKGNCANVSCYSIHLPCLFPQHAPGKKHERQIVLEPWQSLLVEQAPWNFIRGCIRSDGSCFINRTGPYEYLSYDFSNMSEDIVRLFVGACEQVGVNVRVNHGGANARWDVRINQRPSVALMLEHVGKKE